MWAKLKGLLLPLYLNEDGKIIPAAVLQSVLALILLTQLINAPIVLLVYPTLAGAITYCVVIALTVILIALVRRGYVWQTGILLVGTLLILATIANYQWGGLASPGMSAYLLIIVVAALILDPRSMIITTFFAVLALGFLLIQQINGNLPPPIGEMTASLYFIMNLSNIVIAVVLLGFVTQFMRRLLLRLGDSQNELRETLDNLKVTTVSQEYFNRIIRSMSNLLIVLDHEGRITVINPQTLALLGYTEEELIQQPFSKICMLEGQSTFSDLRSQEDTTQNQEYVMITKSGRHIPISLSMSVMREENNVVRGIVCVAQDISHIKASESERLRQAMRFRALFEQANDAIFILDINGNHIAANRRASEMFGYSPEKLSRMSFQDLVVERELPQSRGILDRVLKGEQIPLYERTFRRADGTEMPAEVSIELVYDSDGKPLHLQSVVRDIAERKQSAERTAYQAQLLEVISDAVISTSMDNTILSWNKAAEKVYGWKAEEVMGKKLTEVIPTRVMGAGSDPTNFVKQQYIVRGHWQNELEQISRDGRRLTILSSVSLIRSGGKVHGMVTVNHDITSRKYMEEQLEDKILKIAALRQIDEEMASTLDIERVTEIALQSGYVLSNADAGYLLMYEAGEMHIAHKIGLYENHNPIESHNYGIIQRVIRSKQGEMLLNVVADPEYQPDIESTRSQIIIPLVSQDRLIGVLNLETADQERFTEEIYEYLNLLASRAAIALDNARLYQLAQQQVAELQNLFQRISEVEQLKTDMIRLARHDIGNQIYIIQGYLTLSDEDIIPKLADEYKAYFEGMWGAVNRMNEITSEILSLERIDRIANNDMREEVDLKQMLRRVMFENERGAKVKSQYIISEVPSDPIIIKADRAQLHEAMFNLVENAIKYTPEEGTITARLRATPEEVIFEVQDTGFGIPEDQKAKIFQPGFRARSDETERIKGTGWGLYLVKGIIERHGGEMIFESEYRKGSTFGFVIPFVSRPRRPAEKKVRSLF